MIHGKGDREEASRLVNVNIDKGKDMMHTSSLFVEEGEYY